jgi:virulence-associated protein VapD
MSKTNPSLRDVVQVKFTKIRNDIRTCNAIILIGSNIAQSMDINDRDMVSFEYNIDRPQYCRIYKPAYGDGCYRIINTFRRFKENTDYLRLQFPINGNPFCFDKESLGIVNHIISDDSIVIDLSKYKKLEKKKKSDKNKMNDDIIKKLGIHRFENKRLTYNKFIDPLMDKLNQFHSKDIHEVLALLFFEQQWESVPTLFNKNKIETVLDVLLKKYGRSS